MIYLWPKVPFAPWVSEKRNELCLSYKIKRDFFFARLIHLITQEVSQSSVHLKLVNRQSADKIYPVELSFRGNLHF